MTFLLLVIAFLILLAALGAAADSWERRDARNRARDPRYWGRRR